MNVIINIEEIKEVDEGDEDDEDDEDNEENKNSEINSSNIVIERRRFNNVELNEADEHINSPKTDTKEKPIHKKETDSMAELRKIVENAHKFIDERKEFYDKLPVHNEESKAMIAK